MIKLIDQSFSGWFILLTSLLGFWRVKRWERGILSSQDEAPAPSTPAKPKRTLAELQPPLPRAAPPGRRLTTISATRVALALDPQTESGAEELMAIHMAQAPSTYLTPAERELARGLGQSPEKASKKKKAKFVRCAFCPLLSPPATLRVRPAPASRGGLAERAQHLFSQRSTALALWERDTLPLCV